MLTPNRTLQHGRYQVTRCIGQGGMGAVYEAYDHNLSNRVALKEALVTDPALRRAFEREAKRLDRLRHAALPTVKDHFVEGGGQYLVMEFIDGQDLDEMLKQRGRPFSVGQVLAWADTLLDALAYLHQEGVIHRDIKPANIKLTPKRQIILLDFGLAKGGLTQQGLTGRSLYGFTRGYAPPEQIQGQPTDERSDLYALGATLYVLLTAQAPDDAISRQNYINRAYPDPLQPANQVNPQVPPHVAQALQRAMALDPTQRPASAAQMRALLNALSHNLPPNGVTMRPNAPRSNRLALLLGIMIATVLLFGVLVGAYVVRDGGSEPPIVVETSEPAPTEVAPAETATRTPIAPEVPPPTATEVAPPTATEVAPPTATTATPPPPPTATAEHAATPTLGPGATAIAQKDGMVQVYVPEGDFEMGSADDDPDADDDEKPRHTVYLDAFFVDQTEVTNLMFARFVEQTGHQTEAEKKGSGWTCLPDSNGGFECDYVDGAEWQHPQGPESDLDGLDDHPVMQVSWNDATAYCQWAERRLPTEAEWEKAAGGILTEQGPRKWPWGNEAPTGERLNFCDQNCPFDHKDPSTNDGNEFTSPVGNYLAGASPYGALDMAGNLWEWVSDSYDSNYYASSPRENPQGASYSEDKVIRGGSWDYSAPLARVRNRVSLAADERGQSFGFRCARSP